MPPRHGHHLLDRAASVLLQLGTSLLQHVMKLEDTNMADAFIVFSREQVSAQAGL